MKKRFNVSLWVVSLLLALGPVARGHHGNSAYDESKPVTMKGIVTEFNWANPHAQIYFDVKGSNGHVEHWGCETLSPGRLIRAGWNKDSVKAGDQITITLVAAKNGAPVGFLQRLVFADGRQLLPTE